MDIESPYCQECESCGESGCCKPYSCTMSDKCEYKETYLQELKFGYSVYEEIMKSVYEKLSPELKSEVDAIWEKEWEHWNNKPQINEKQDEK